MRRNLKTVPNMFSVKSNQTVRRRAAVPKSGGGGQYTPDPWRVSEHAANDHWSIVAGSLLNDGRQVALIPDAAMSEESQANARLIAQALSLIHIFLDLSFGCIPFSRVSRERLAFLQQITFVRLLSEMR